MGAAVAGAVLGRPYVARAAVRTLHLGHTDPETGLYADGARAFAAAVAADPQLSGTVQVAIQGNAVLGDELTLMKGCMNGTIDLVLCSTVVAGNLVAGVDLLYIPFLFNNVVAARAALDGAVGSDVAASMKQKGLNVLAWAERGMAYIGADRPVRNLADLQGLKIRLPQSDVMLGGFRALGAAPGALPFTMIPEAMRTGQFQALENSIVTFEPSKFYEYTKILSLTGHFYDSALFLASGDVLEDLTPAQVKALSACAVKGGLVTRQVADAAESIGFKRVTQLGMTVVRDVDRPALRTAAHPYMESLAVGENAVFVQQLIAAGV
jgi:TRAP-type C4-dicarboxylate transport system substrate-binding protein